MLMPISKAHEYDGIYIVGLTDPTTGEHIRSLAIHKEGASFYMHAVILRSYLQTVKNLNTKAGVEVSPQLRFDLVAINWLLHAAPSEVGEMYLHRRSIIRRVQEFMTPPPGSVPQRIQR